MATRSNKPVLAAQLFSCRDHLKTPASFSRSMKRLRKIGYKHVQVSGVGDVSPMEIKKRCDDAGVTVIGSHIGVGDIRDNFADVVDRLHVWNCAYVAIPWEGFKDCRTVAQVKKVFSDWNKLGKALKAEGITLQYHNHAHEFEKVGGKTILEILYDSTDPKYLQAEIDTCWVARGGADPADWCLKMKGRLDQVHLKDTVISGGQPVFAEIGDGNLNWPAVFAACKKAKVKHYIVEQDSDWIKNDPFKSMEVSFKNIKKMKVGL